MALVLLGVVLLVLRWLEVPPVAGWSLWVMFAPFALALAWWAWSDATGRTRRLHEARFSTRRARRRREALIAMGTHPDRDERGRARAGRRSP